MDDGHKFDDNMLELYYASKLLSVGGVLVLHDTWLKSVRTTANFIEANFKFFELLPLLEGISMRVAVKRTHHDRRGFRHFASFEVPYASGLPGHRLKSLQTATARAKSNAKLTGARAHKNGP